MSFIDNLKTRVTPILFSRLGGKMTKSSLPIAFPMPSDPGSDQ